MIFRLILTLLLICFIYLNQIRNARELGEGHGEGFRQKSVDPFRRNRPGDDEIMYEQANEDQQTEVARYD